MCTVDAAVISHFVFEFLCRTEDIDPDESLYDMYKRGLAYDPRDVTKMMRKAALSKDEFFAGFPTLERLIQLHQYDAAYVRFDYEPESLVGEWPHI